MRGARRIMPLVLAVLGSATFLLHAQADGQEPSEQIQKLTAAIARTQAQLDESQRQLDDLRQQLSALQQEMTNKVPETSAPVPPSPPAESSSAAQPSPEPASPAIDDLRDRQTLQESQIATLNQDKVETESKYPVRITGMVLMNAFVNTNAVDMAATPTVAVGGPGSTGASVRQTVFGFDARGPHLFGARSYADLRLDFDGNPQSANNSAGYYYANPTLLRLRTAHAGLLWKNTEAYFSLDRPILNPDTPTSLTAVAEPALAWSGNLWTWNPQLGIRHDLNFANSHDLRFEAALMDVGDAPLAPPAALSSTSATAPPSSGERSRWPGVETRVSLLGSGSNEESNHLGIGGYFAPHSSSLGYNFDSWAATLDTRLSLPLHLQLTGNFYRGLALGGLGAGAYKDFVYRPDTETGGYYFKSLDDVGGWTQLKEKFTQRVELNAAFGIDNVFARELRRYALTGAGAYLNLAANRTYTGNIVFSPSAYLLFSLEYRRLESTPVIGLPAASNIIGLGAGYKF
jgi:uncharacterized coiled-coil protein SlyX